LHTKTAGALLPAGASAFAPWHSEVSVTAQRVVQQSGYFKGTLSIASREKQSTCFAEIACRRFTGAAILLDLIIDLLTINEGGETGAFNGGDMDEDVLTTAIGLNEAKTLGAVEPFHGSSRHMRLPL
jgi:hypothetical protein